MSNKTFKTDTKIYNVPNGGTLRRTKRPDGISFLTQVSQWQSGEACQASVEVELLLTNHHGTLAIAMRRVTSKPNSWYCNTSRIHLPPRAAADLAQAIKSLNERLRHCA